MESSGSSGIVRPVIVAGALPSTGPGGFIDGIVLHPMPRWHHMYRAGGEPR